MKIMSMMTGKRQMLLPFSERTRRIIQVTIGYSASLLVPRKAVGQILFEAISEQVKKFVAGMALPWVNCDF